ncbi:hypothetical protein HDV05_006138 [Chytridiales sp. JEL 0842]|nr:hypothetical protein HDV05_006138 [Chytridiales sp. JEL 0842]
MDTNITTDTLAQFHELQLQLELARKENAQLQERLHTLESSSKDESQERLSRMSTTSTEQQGGLPRSRSRSLEKEKVKVDQIQKVLEGLKEETGKVAQGVEANNHLEPENKEEMLNNLNNLTENLNHLTLSTLPSLRHRISKIKDLETRYKQISSTISHETCEPREAEVMYLNACRNDLQEAKDELEGLKRDLGRRDEDVKRLASVVECAIERMMSVADDNKATQDQIEYLTSLTKKVSDLTSPETAQAEDIATKEEDVQLHLMQAENARLKEELMCLNKQCSDANQIRVQGNILKELDDAKIKIRDLENNIKLQALQLETLKSGLDKDKVQQMLQDVEDAERRFVDTEFVLEDLRQKLVSLERGLEKEMERREG